MKKNYLKPEVEILDFVVANMIAASVGGNDEETQTPLSNQHRGEWGNIWAN